MKQFIWGLLGIIFFTYSALADEPSVQVSESTSTCIDCHSLVTPGIVAGWKKGTMARTTPGEAKKAGANSRKVSFKELPEELTGVVVGCAECHMLNPGEHKDNFEHSGFQVHTVVSAGDCATCHPAEAGQYEGNLMSHAYGNLRKNALYQDLVASVNGIQTFQKGKIIPMAPDMDTDAESCFSCHGTLVEVKRVQTRDTSMGEMEFPVLSGWPNQGVGRINPDGTRGACTACHPRHQFSIETARKPHTCSQCHKGPDVPAYKVYKVSKHGNLYSSLGKEWDYKKVPWTVGDDFTAPTCAVCHISLLVSVDGEVIAERTHRMNDRIPWRIFGLIYSHPHPKSPDTSIIRNEAGLPLPTELTGEPVSKYLIDAAEQDKRENNMKSVCISCHSGGWVDNHFSLLRNTLEKTDKMTQTSTELLVSAWNRGAAKGISQNDSIFNEAIEKKWVEQWLFFANSTRLASAMGGADYGVFANGRWYMSKNIREMINWLEFKE